ncbi:MAG: hypothetical protein ACREIC_06245 [Limisphaerales bacterium]
MGQTIPLWVPDDLLQEVRETAKATHLSVQDVFRQSTKIGLAALRQSLRGHPPKPRRLSAYDALRSGNDLNVEFPTMDGKVKKVEL